MKEMYYLVSSAYILENFLRSPSQEELYREWEGVGQVRHLGVHDRKRVENAEADSFYGDCLRARCDRDKTRTS